MKNNIIDRNLNLKRIGELNLYLESYKSFIDFKNGLFVNPAYLSKAIEDQLNEYEKKIS